jgi:cysteinyl-tRNA synthetase
MHGEFLTLGDAKMAKSAGHSIRVSELPEKGFGPLDFRYLALTAHYRSKLDFTEAAMHAAVSGLARLRRAVAAGASGASDQTDGGSVDLAAEPMAGYRERFAAAISEDLGIPAALAIAHAVAAGDDLAPAQRRALLLDFDRVFGLSLVVPQADDEELPEGAAELLERRAAARAAHDYATSDRLRQELAAMGVEVRDTPTGQQAKRRR